MASLPKIELRADQFSEWILVYGWWAVKVFFMGILRHPLASIPAILFTAGLIGSGNFWATVGFLFSIISAIVITIAAIGPAGWIVLGIIVLLFFAFDMPGQIKDVTSKGIRYVRVKYQWDLPAYDRLMVNPSVRAYWLRSHWSKACRKSDLIGNREHRLAEPRIVSLAPMPYGLKGQVNMSATGKTAEYFAQHAERLSSSLGRVKVVARPVSANIVDVKFYWHDPLAGHITEMVPIEDNETRIPYGVSEDGLPVSLAPFFSTLIAGRSGAGKSSLVWSYVKGLLDNGIPFVVTIIDPKSGMEFRRFQKMGAAYGYTEKDYVKLLENTYANMTMRERWLASQGLEKLEVVDEKNPLHIIIIDELIEVVNKQTEPLIRSILNRGRATGFVLFGLSQATVKEVIGQNRDYFAQRIMMASKSKEMTDAALGAGATNAGALAHQIQIPGEEGIGYELNESATIPTRFRALKVDPEQKDNIVERVAAMLDIIRSTWSPGDRTGIVYKYYDAAHAHEEYNKRTGYIYIGKTIRGSARFGEHHDTKDWIRDAAGIDLEHFDTECDTLKREAELIFQYKPPHNKQGKTKKMEPEC